ncbi:MAG TPA: DNA polymerase III subunit delta' [Stellaceae bacterium]|nr:DNA polymerase III subunit delta' [Stellaceae bacterium]
MSGEPDDDDDIAAAGPGAGAVLLPRENPDLIGHDTAEAALFAAYRAGRLPHAWLLTGPRGIGKATLAFRFARFLLAESERTGQGLFAAPPPSGLALAPDSPAFRRVASGGHPDLLVVERGYDPRRRRLRSEIVVADTRSIVGFLRLTAAEGGWRVVILDGADAMNRNAANAVLKILEEPPARAVLMLVSENPGRLTPTIRSRCRRLALKPLPCEAVEAALRRRLPALGADDTRRIAQLAHGSIGRALALASAEGLELYRQLFGLIAPLPLLDGEALHGFADRIARNDAEDGFALVSELLPGWIARMVALAAGEGGETAVLPGEVEAMQRLAARRSLDQWVEVWENLGHLFDEADSINLDRKQVVLNAFFALEAAAR